MFLQWSNSTAAAAAAAADDDDDDDDDDGGVDDIGQYIDNVGTSGFDVVRVKCIDQVESDWFDVRALVLRRQLRQQLLTQLCIHT